MMTIVFGTVLPWLLIAIGTWLAHELVRQNGRILLRLEAIEQQIGPGAAPRAGAQRREAGGLPLGAVAPDFELPDLTGVRRKLSEFREQNVLLVFFNPQCGFCTRMAADLAALPTESDEQRAVPIVVTTGDAEENRALVERYGIRCLVLLQQQMEVAAKYGAQGTPMGYRIDAAGRIASELAVGAEPLLRLATTPARPEKGVRNLLPGGPEGGFAQKVPDTFFGHGAKGDPSLARSRLNRGGLKAGVPAPDFRLPRIDAGELSLTDFRGGRVLLVFSDPDCGPCDELAPRLQEIHLRRPDLQVLVVSRRDPEANRAKAARLGLTFPIVLQRQWEVSLKYAMFATPIGYLIDEQGILASDVAVGVGPILALAGEGVHESLVDESWPLAAEQTLAT
ncbi:MAG: peroxiredoxin family protein [Planctomycetes bacterium]|nr:peroxiredoxin family protein [Planctomycetota bacterium]